MTPEPVVTVEMTLLEAAHLTDLLAQFEDLVTEDDRTDPALRRLVPDAYRDDPDAAAEFRRLTQGDLFDRRTADARTMRAGLLREGRALRPADLDRASAEDVLTVTLDGGASSAWLRTLAALRLVVAHRLGIADEADHDEDDPRFGVYEWLGYRLDGLVQALDDLELDDLREEG